jgi:hypothetical protein
MRKLRSLRLLICLVGTLALAATAVIGVSLTNSAVTTEESATTDGELVTRPRPPVNIEPPIGSADNTAAPTVVDAGESPTPDGAIGIARIGDGIAPIDGGTLEGAAAAARYGPDVDPGLTSPNTDTGDATVAAPATTDVSQISLTSDSGGVGGEGVPYTGSATGLPSFVGPGNVTSGGGSDTSSATPVPEAATFVLVVFPLLAALIVRLRG